ncbi:MAG: PQQ-binding-like beta-propeller repeat protein [Candidatus Bathyarchaeia archaeon]
MKKLSPIIVLTILLFSTFASTYIVNPNPSSILAPEWTYKLQSFCEWGYFGSSPAIGDIRGDVAGLEIIVGSDECINWYPELGRSAYGIWRILNASGSCIWAKDTEADASKSSPALADINKDGYLEIVGGTSGINVEAIDRYGNFVWTFPSPPMAGAYFLWHSSPAAADIDPSISGLEIVVGDSYGNVWAFDGENFDYVNEGITVTDPWIYGGTEGIDWDVLWKFQTDGPVLASPVLGDIDNDELIEVVIGSEDGKVYVLNGRTGDLKWSYQIGSAVYSSAALANLDGDSAFEVIIGSLDGYLYCLDGATGSLQWMFRTSAPVYSSPVVYVSTIYVGSLDGRIYALDANGNLQWAYDTGKPIYSSLAIANRGVNVGIYIGSGSLYNSSVGSGALYLLDALNGSLIDLYETASITVSPSVADIDGDGRLEIIFYDWTATLYALEDKSSKVTPYAVEWPMFRHDAMRTGNYLPTTKPTIYSFPSGTYVIPMDEKQNILTTQNVSIYGFVWSILNSGATIYRIIKPPSIALKTIKYPGGNIYSGGVILVPPVHGYIVENIKLRFPNVTVDKLTEPFSAYSDQLSIVDKPTKVLVVYGEWGHTEDTLNQMKIPYTLVTRSVASNNATIFHDFDLVVIDCPGWFGATPTNVIGNLTLFVAGGGEVIFTDVALMDLSRVFPGYVHFVTGNLDWVGNVRVHNPPLYKFSPEFPSQYPATFPYITKIYLMHGGVLVDEVLNKTVVRVVMETSEYDRANRTLAFYFPYGKGLVEGFAYHPQEQTENFTGDPYSYVISCIFYGNKFIHVTPRHDLAVVNVVTSASNVIQGNTIKVNVTVLNKGTLREAFGVTVYANSTIIGSKTFSNLTSSAMTTLTFNWNTATFISGEYVISAVVTQAPGEANLADNVLIDDTVIISPPTISYELAITTTQGGTTSPSTGVYSYPAGTMVSVTALPDTNYVFSHWVFDGENITVNPITISMSVNHTLHAVFIPAYTLTIASMIDGATNPAPGIYTYPVGAVVDVTAIPGVGRYFDHWVFDGESVNANPISVTFNDYHMLHAVFSLKQCTLTIGAATEGTTDPPPGTYTCTYGTIVNVTAVPYINYALDHWELDGVNKGALNPIQIPVIANSTLLAVFKYAPILYSLKISTSAGGTTDPQPGTYLYPSETIVSVTAVPYANYIFNHWEIDGVLHSSENPINITMNTNHTLQATFTYSPAPPPQSRENTLWGCGYWPDPTVGYCPAIMDWGQSWDTYIMYEPMFGTDVVSGQLINWLGESIEWVNSTCIKVVLRRDACWVKITDWDAWQAGTGGFQYYRPITAEDVKYSFYLYGAFDESPGGKYWHMGDFKERVGSIDNFVIESDWVFYVRIKTECMWSSVVWRSLTRSYLIVPADLWKAIERWADDWAGGWIPNFKNDWTLPLEEQHPNAPHLIDYLPPELNGCWRVASGMFLPWVHQTAEWPKYTIMKKNPLWWGKHVIGKQSAIEYLGYYNYEKNEDIYPGFASGEIDWDGNYIPVWHLRTYLNNPPYFIDKATKIIVPNHRKYPLNEPWLHKAIAYVFNFTLFNQASSEYLKPASPLYIPADDTVARQYLNTTIEDKYRISYNLALGLLTLNNYCIKVNGTWYTKSGPNMDWLEEYLADNVDLTVGKVTHPAQYWYENGFEEADELPEYPGVNVALGPWTIIDVYGWTDINGITQIIADNVTNLLGITLVAEFPDQPTYVNMMNALDFDFSHYCMHWGINGDMYERYSQMFMGTAGCWSHYGDYRNSTLVQLLAQLDTPPPGKTRQEIANKIQEIIGSEMPMIPTAGHPDWYIYLDTYWVRWPHQNHPFLPCSPYGGSSQTANLHFLLLALGSSAPGAYADIDNNHKVELKDMLTAKKAYGSYPGHSNWDFTCDISPTTPVMGNGVVDLQDILEIKKNYGKAW